ncbi:MAG: NADPH:quinone oxidoreductase family protein [Alphaproteobacteria bacterium]|jgi:NADPH:quinone reductase|nr:MAG: NADPH:quinone oxidoreductase family protein [Alphaproteobacteria bacterium]
MRAVVCEALAQDFSRVALKDLPIPEPGAGEIRVRVEAASLNFPDLLMLKGEYQFKPAPPFTVGMDLAGVVDAVGPGVAMQPGQRVAGGAKTGAFANYAICPASSLHPIPEAMSAAHAAAYPAAYTTAYVSLVERGQLQAGETLLVHGASGGVGMASVDVGRILGANVIATTASPEKADALKAAGANHVIVLGDKPGDNFREQVKALTNGRGADVIFDPVGGDIFDESTRCIAFNGRLLVIGFAGGRIASVNTNIPLIKGFSVIGVRAGEYGRQLPQRGRIVRDQIWRWAAEGVTQPKVFAELPLEQWREAFEQMRDRRLVGKIILKP